MKLQFSLLTFFLCSAFICVYFAGYQSGFHTMREIGNRIEVFATVQYENCTVQRSFFVNEGETHRMAGPELNDFFVEINPTRIAGNATSPTINQTTISLSNIPVSDVEKQILETTPDLISSNSISFDHDRNAITIKKNSPELLANLAALAAFSDKSPFMYHAQLRIGKTMPDGSQVIFFEPTLLTLENHAAKIQNGQISVELRFDDIPPTRR